MTAPGFTGPVLLFMTPPHQCSYLPDRDATTAFVDPLQEKNPALYTELARQGFRRSGEHVYRPQCTDCQACISVRVPVAEFKPRRRQRRAWQANQDVRVSAATPQFRDEDFRLYQRYISARHPGGGMDDPTPDQYLEFLSSSWSQTVFYQFRAGDDLLAVAVTDPLSDGLSAVYAFFEPTASNRSLGTYTILWQLVQAKRLELPWLYLGYWIEASTKMSYKADYRPQERFVGHQWVRVE